MEPVTVDKPISELKPMEVKCSDARCNEGFHYYTSKIVGKGENVGDCKYCGDSSVDWKRIHQHNPDDLEYTFDCLKRELLRQVCWVNDIDSKAILRARKRGRNALKQRAKKILTRKISHPPVTYWDNKCTPKSGTEIIHYGQHATATCCRKCLERWHNMPADIILTEEQIDYCVGLIELFINDRVPNITNEGEPQIKIR